MLLSTVLGALAFSAATSALRADDTQIWSTPGVGAASRQTKPFRQVWQPKGRFQQLGLPGQMPGLELHAVPQTLLMQVAVKPPVGVGQSAGEQQPEMHAVVPGQTLNGAAQPQTPSPEQVWLVAQGVTAPVVQLPLEQVPAACLLVRLAHPALPQDPVPKVQVPPGPGQVPLQAALVPWQSRLLQHVPSAMQAVPQEWKPGAQVVQRPAPVHVKLPPQLADAGVTQAPTLLQVGPAIRWPFAAQLALPHEAPVGNTQGALVLGQVPAHMGLLPPHSAAVQQLACAIHPPLQGLKPELQPHTPAPVHDWLVPQGVGAGSVQLPPEHVPAARCVVVVVQVGLPHEVPVGYTQGPLVLGQVPAQLASVPLHSAAVQQLPDGMHAVPHGLNPAAQLLHKPAPVQVNPFPQGAGVGITQVPFEQVPVPMRFAPEQLAVPQPLVG